MAGTLFIVATPIGNLDDISARALKVLGEVPLIAAEDTRRTSHLLQRFGLTTRCTSFHEHNAKSKAPDLVGRLTAGESIALVTDAGTPGVSDPGQELVILARESGIQIVPIPGPSAVTTALSVCGFPGDGFAFLGFPPSKGSPRRLWFERLVTAGSVIPLMVFYEAPHRIERTLSELAALVGELPVFVGRELTKVHEELIFGLTTNMVPPKTVGEFVVVVNFGHRPDNTRVAPVPEPGKLAEEFRSLTEESNLSRRQVISSLSRKYGLPAREVYALVESAKRSAV